MKKNKRTLSFSEDKALKVSDGGNHQRSSILKTKRRTKDGILNEVSSSGLSFHDHYFHFLF